jgi:serine/threonine-protein kinase
MEWVDGVPLSMVMREAARRGVMPLNIAVKIVQDVCAGLHAAHELKGDDGKSLQLVHRDISPQNIMVAESGVVKLLDFGVAKALGRSAGETDTGLIRGKLAYLAPEQVVAKPLDRRADLFAVGVILYQLSTGKHPFRADNAGATMNNILRRKVPSPSKVLGSSYPRTLEKVVMRALDRELEFRFQTAADMFKALDEVFVGRDRATTEDVAAFVAPIIGPSGEEFRKALKNACRGPTTSGSDVATMLADSAVPVESTPASGEWMMRSASLSSFEPSDSDLDEPADKAASKAERVAPAPLPGLSKAEGASVGPPARVASAPLPPAPATPAPPIAPATEPGSEYTMSGTGTDAIPARAGRSRRMVGVFVVTSVVLVAAVVLIVARFLQARPVVLDTAGTTVSAVESTSPAVSAPPTAEVVSSAGPVADAAAEPPAEAGPEAIASAQPPSTAQPPTATAGGTRTSNPPSTKPTSTGKWTPPVSDPGF